MGFKKSDTEPIDQAFSNVSDSNKQQTYVRGVLSISSNYLADCTKYAEYPINVIQTNEHWLCIEQEIQIAVVNSNLVPS